MANLSWQLRESRSTWDWPLYGDMCHVTSDAECFLMGRSSHNYFDAFANAFALALFEVRVNLEMSVCGRPSMESKKATLDANALWHTW